MVDAAMAPSCPSPTDLLDPILLLTFLTLFSLSIKHERTIERDCVSRTSAFSPALSSVGPYSPHRFNGTFDAPSPYRGEPSPEVDAAWSRITDIGLFGLSDDEVKKTDPTFASSAVRLPAERGGEVGGSLEVFHQLHCLNLVRQYTYRDYYADKMISFQDAPEVVRTHIDHCLEMLRQVVMCQSDLGVLTYNWVQVQETPWPNFNTEHQCRDFEKVLEWGKEAEIMEFEEKMTKTKGVDILQTPP